MISRRAFLATTAASLASHAIAEAPSTSLIPPLRPERGKGGSATAADALIRKADLGGAVGYLVADAKTGEVLEAVNPNAPLAPASVNKILTALFALDSLGPDHRFRTQLIDDAGRLVLKGGGDPMLNTDHLAELVKRAKAAGLSAAGHETFYYDDSALPELHEIDPSQAVHFNYNPAISGLNLNFNQVYFQWQKTGDDYAVTMDARTEKLRPTVQIAQMSISERDRPVYDFREDGTTEIWSVARSALGKGGGRWLPVRHPGPYTAEVFQRLARAEGIELGPFARRKGAAGRVIAEWTSAPLAEIIDVMLEYSVNIISEVIGLTASRAQGLSASAEVMRRTLSGYGVRSAVLADHSGLSSETRISVREMTEVLLAAAPRGALKPLMKSIPMRDAKGKAIKNHPVSVHAKSGTLNFVSNLAGYADVPGGRTLAFAIFAGDLERRAAANATGDDIPQGVSAWTKRARALQNDLIDRWGKLYAG